MDIHSVTQQRPSLYRNDGRFMRPLFGELALSIDEFIKERHVVWTNAGEEDEVMRPDQHVHAVDLQQSDLPDGARDARGIGSARGPGTIESLRCQSDAACLRKR